MRLLTTALLVAIASPASAGPLETLQYRTTLRTDRPVTTGPALNPWETAYHLGGSPAFGVVAGNIPQWTSVDSAYPGASFSITGAGGLTTFTASERVDDLGVRGSGRYSLDVELRDQAGRVGVVSFSGQFEAGWWGGHGFAWPVFDIVDPGTGGVPPFLQPPSGSVWLGRTRYDVQLGYGWPPSYMQNEDGSWEEIRYASDSVPSWDGSYWMEGSGSLYLTITPAQTPEPCTLILAGVGACGVWVASRRRCRCG